MGPEHTAEVSKLCPWKRFFPKGRGASNGENGEDRISLSMWRRSGTAGVRPLFLSPGAVYQRGIRRLDVYTFEISGKGGEKGAEGEEAGAD